MVRRQQRRRVQELDAQDWKPDAEFRRQVATIDAGIAEIRRLFRDGWIDVIAPNGTPLSFPQILDRLSIQPRFRRGERERVAPQCEKGHPEVALR
jgi:hypothetical protein